MPYVRPMRWVKRARTIRSKRVYTRRKVSKPVKRYVRKQFNKIVETKYATRTFTSSPDNVGTVHDMIPAISQGTGDSNRIGDTILIKGIYMRYALTVADNTNYVRMIAFQWKGNSVPTITSVLSGVAPTFLSHYNKDTEGLYTILFDKTHTLILGDYRPCSVHYKKVFLKYCRKKLQYVSGTNTQVNDTINVLCISDSTTSTHPLIEFNIRWYYQDA